MGTPHKHAELIKAWADGAEIQFLNAAGDWVSTNGNPGWFNCYQYRVKPEPKKIQIRFFEDTLGFVRCWTNTWKRSWEQIEKNYDFKRWLGPVEEREFDV